MNLFASCLLFFSFSVLVLLVLELSSTAQLETLVVSACRARTTGTEPFSRGSWEVHFFFPPCFRSTSGGGAVRCSSSSSSKYLPTKEAHRRLSSSAPQPLRSSIVSDDLTRCTGGIPPFSRGPDPEHNQCLWLSSLRIAPSISIPTITFFSASSVVAGFHIPDARSQNVTSSDPSFLGNVSSSPSFKLTLSSLLWFLSDGSMFPLLCSSSGDHSFGADERHVSQSVLEKFRVLLFPYGWAWPTCTINPFSLRSYLARPICLEKDTIQILTVFGDWVSFSKNSSGFIGFSVCCTLSYLFSGMHLPVDSPGTVLFQSSSSYGEKLLSPFPLSTERGISSVLLLSVCSNFFIDLSSCGAVSTGPEDASEITSVIFVDGAWTPTSHYVTILQLSDFVAKACPTHSSTVLNSLSSSIEDLPYLAYLFIVFYACCQRGRIIPSSYCSDED